MEMSWELGLNPMHVLLSYCTVMDFGGFRTAVCRIVMGVGLMGSKQLCTVVKARLSVKHCNLPSFEGFGRRNKLHVCVGEFIFNACATNGAVSNMDMAQICLRVLLNPAKGQTLPRLVFNRNVPRKITSHIRTLETIYKVLL